MEEEFPYLDSREAIQSYISSLAQAEGVSLDDPKFPAALDKRDKLAHLRFRFCVPTIEELVGKEQVAEGIDSSEDCIYFLGNSLGLQPKAAKDMVIDCLLDKWAKQGAEGRYTEPFPWATMEDVVVEESARIVGAKPLEVIPMNGLTVNCHLAMVSFYRPSKDRFKILLEKECFPSDHYAVQSQAHWHGYDPKEAMIIMPPREGEHFWRTEDVLKVIEEQGDSIALVWLPGIHYITGYVFDMETITKVAHSKGCMVGFDLAHAAGNVELHLHDWDVDVAAWCSYKYMNGGPGGIAGFFVHERHAHNEQLPRLLGWWSHNRQTRFEMSNELELQPGAAGWQVSNTPVYDCLILKASLDVFAETSMRELVTKSRILTGYLEMLIEQYLSKEARERTALVGSSQQEGPPDKRPCVKYVTVVTPTDPKQRGCQLSLQFSFSVTEVFGMIKSRGVLTDLRKDGHMRIAPAPLYNSFQDVWRFYQILKLSLE